MAEDLSQERNRLANRVREQLWRYYPQALELGDDLAADGCDASVTCLPGKKSVHSKEKADSLSSRRYRQTRPLRAFAAAAGVFTVGIRPPDCRAILTLIVAPHAAARSVGDLASASAAAPASPCTLDGDEEPHSSASSN